MNPKGSWNFGGCDLVSGCKLLNEQQWKKPKNFYSTPSSPKSNMTYHTNKCIEWCERG